ncbi:MAG: HAMP domain-containing histidine kinase [Tissierellia bacterium]|nr:HAMP domain-containing histidine kinase [Tissierellia bacterium]
MEFIIILMVLLLISIIYGAKQRKENKRILASIDRMIDSAKNGEFVDYKIDESMLSKVEIKFLDFLKSSLLTKGDLEREKATINRMISDISHQIKTPLANMILYSELIKEKETLTDFGRDSIERVLYQGEKLKFLIGALVRMSRLETGIISLNPTLSNVDFIILNSITGLKEKADEKEIEVVYEKSDVKALFDEKWTEEAIYNILDNAIKYSRVNSSIKISASVFEMFTRIDIEDFGIGISEIEHSKIFQRFYRSKDVSKIEGLGLGLYLAREIIMNQGGYIKLTSKENAGSTFSIYLPRG